jgi:tetratricopeptide (TPR) repeat protein
MARKQQLLGSSIGIEPMLTAPWTAEKQQSLENDLRTAKIMLEKSDLSGAEVQRTQRQLHYLRQQLPRSADVYKLSGVLAHRIGCHAEAESLTRQAIALNSQDPDLYGNLAIALRAQQRVHEAQEVIETALETVPNSAVLQRNLGNLLSDQGAYQAAAERYRKSLQLRPAHRDTWVAYSFALARSRQLADAVQALRKAAAQGFDELDMLRTVGQWLIAQTRGPQAVGVFARALQHDEHDIPSLFGMGVALIQADRLQDADYFFDQVLEQDPEHVQSLSHKASIALRRHNRKAAREYVERGLEIAPDAPGLKVDLATVLFHEDNLAGAEQLCREALRTAPGLPAAYSMLAQIASTNGDFEASRKYA